MSNGGTVVELDAQVDTLLGALVAHAAVVREAEERVVADPDDEEARTLAAEHREIVADYTAEIGQLRAEIAAIPAQRRETFGS